MKLSRILIALIFLTVWGGMVLALMPLKLMVEQWGAPQGLEIRDPSGTLWDGQAGVSFNVGEKPIPVAALIDWSWCPSWRRGLLSLCFELENEALSGHGLLYRTLLGGKVGVENARFQVNLGQYTDRLIDAPATVFGAGNIKVDNALFNVDTRLPEVISASGKLSRMKADDIDLGDYVWRLSTSAEGQAIEARMSGGADAFQVKAQAQLTLADRAYQYEAELSSESEKVRKIVAPFAESKGKGVYVAKGGGEIKPL